MSETFYGPWALQVVNKQAQFDERVTIRGSQNSDGSFAGTVGAILSIQGAEWTVELEWSDDHDATWHASRIRRTYEVSPVDGLVVNLGADDNVDALADSDYDDLVVSLKYLDPAANPPAPANLMDFTLPREWITSADR